MKNTGHFHALNKAFFQKHQTKLLWLLNNRFTKRWFRYVLRIRQHDCGMTSVISSIAPNAFTFDRFLMIKEGKLVQQQTTDFRTHNKYSKRLYFAFKWVWWTMHGFDMLIANRFVPQLNLGFDTLTVYPDADPETTTVDGQVAYSVGGQTWATVHDSAGTIADDTTASNYYTEIFSSAGSNQWGRIYRSIFLFDTSSLGASVSISATVMSLFGTGKNDPNSALPNIDIYTSTPASNTSLATSDYQQFGTTSQTGSPITYAGYSTTAYNDFTFNATGIGNVSKTSISKFGARNANYDVANTPPTWVASDSWRHAGYFADQAGTTNDPKLVVTYTVPATAQSISSFLLMNVG